ncbi:hypothetical protein MO867_10760 [Microbulbifer sp. OS29]|uniref:Uncharacterized protein n=1 Tax=Microbulbifer okhotskensis TaxID=2926617 RepID=A0A9X2ESB5_9GAMM|nr:hypothetical protein [Microbulbifer okhotskensis]MCO1334821.1 hypothetical protein [Microbulbifer okhotskensis]
MEQVALDDIGMTISALIIALVLAIVQYRAVLRGPALSLPTHTPLYTAVGSLGAAAI